MVLNESNDENDYESEGCSVQANDPFDAAEKYAKDYHKHDDEWREGKNIILRVVEIFPIFRGKEYKYYPSSDNRERRINVYYEYNPEYFFEEAVENEN